MRPVRDRQAGHALAGRGGSRYVPRMDTETFDVLVIGAGMAGATAAAHLAADHRTALIEAEEMAGYHTTGRSAAMWILNYGPRDVQALTGLSRAFLRDPPAGFAEAKLITPRGVAYAAPAGEEALLRQMIAEGTGIREISVADLRAIVPALRPGWAAAAAVEDDAYDIDVATLHQGFLRLFRHRGGMLALRSRTMRIDRAGGLWHVAVTGGATFRARILVDAAGAWGDEVAAQAGIAPIGLTPMRRTGVIIDPAPWQVAGWPILHDAGHSWYCRPEARTRLMLCPCDETPMPPQDIQPDELDIALVVDRVQQALDITVRRVERSWAGLRTFSPDRSLVFGRDPAEPAFVWCVGQGGYGIQTSPAAGRLIADMVADRDSGVAASVLAAIDPARFAAGHRTPRA
jgi:D-arginine dehydrogenase